MSRPPNIIYILGDDQRAELLSCMGHPLVQTPHLDQLAAVGTLFTNARCTSPLCTPSRACHYTGQWERAHAVNFNSGTALSQAAWQQTFPGQLAAAGYWTAWVGKNHVPVGEGGYESGFMEQWFDCWWGNHGHSSFYPKELGNGKGAVYQAAQADTQAEVFAEGALNVIQPQADFLARSPTPFPTRPADKPFCMCVTFNLPHGASTSTMQLRPTDDELYRSAYRDNINAIDLPETWKPWKASYAKLPPEVYNATWIPDYDYVKTPQDLRERIVRQCQVITGIDRFIGQLRQALQESGEAENTIIVFSTDHGLLFGEHGLGGKALLYEPALRIPLIIHDPRPGAARGQRCAIPVAVPDLAPTMLDLCGLPIPTTMQGCSLAPILHGDTPQPRSELFIENLFDAQNYPRCEGLVGERFKYLRYYARQEDPETTSQRLRGTLDDYETCRQNMGHTETPIYEELFDLAKDPHEVTNVLDAPEYAEDVIGLRERCDAEARRLRPPGPPATVSSR